MAVIQAVQEEIDSEQWKKKQDVSITWSQEASRTDRDLEGKGVQAIFTYSYRSCSLLQTVSAFAQHSGTDLGQCESWHPLISYSVE